MVKFFCKYLFIAFVFIGCRDRQVALLQEMNRAETGIGFINRNADTDTLNIFDYLYYYNGAGVAAGDINNDGLTDIYFVSNQESNKLYLNKGNFRFEDITEASGVSCLSEWKTGVTMADVNADGWLDIYVCVVANHTPKSTGRGDGKTYFKGTSNKLFINNRTPTPSFTESSAQYGLNISGYSTQSAFFDYDKDGDLDMFLLQHSIHQTDTYGDTSLRRKYSDVSGCKLYRNDSGYYNNATKGSGLLSSALGYGLGVAVSDFNHDGWEDVYVGNDFHENDYYFINNANGTFSEKNREAFGHQSNFSMGNDAVDFNNDGQTDIITLDMLPQDEVALKSSITDESFDEYEHLHTQMGYHHQYSRNCLQVNIRNGNRFAETGLYSGIAATDWSWSVLSPDINLDGKKDVFITNGIKKRLNDLDFIRFRSAAAIQENKAGPAANDEEFLSHMPDGAWHNYMFINDGDLKFSDRSVDYGFTKPTISSGAAYADLDNDGDLDLITNNMNAEAGIFKNLTREKDTASSFLSLRLKSNSANRFAIGAKVFLFQAQRMQYQQLQPSRGFMSSVEPVLNFGLIPNVKIDSILLIWPNNKYQVIKNCRPDSIMNVMEDLTLPFLSGVHHSFVTQLLDHSSKFELEDITSQTGLMEWSHKENLSYNDFNRNPFIPHQLSTLGPAVAVGDINGDLLEDIFLGAAKNQPAALFLQTREGKFNRFRQPAIENDSLMEDVQAAFFDSDMDGDLDLYVASGGMEFYGKAPALKDRLYVNDGHGNFSASSALPPLLENKGALAIADMDKDGNFEIFSGGRADANNYGEPPASFLLKTMGNGIFTESVVAQDKTNSGMKSGAAWADLDLDGYPELITAGEFDAPQIYKYKSGKLHFQNDYSLKQLTGMWQSLFITDINGDKLPDIFLGNYGLNSKLRATTNYPLKLYCKDIDENGNTDQLLSIASADGRYYNFLGKETFEKQLPYIKKEFLSYRKMAGKTTEEVFGKKIAGARELKLVTLASVVLINKGNLKFELQQLPSSFQWMPIFAFEKLSNSTVVAAGNFYGVLPFEGRYDNGMMPVATWKEGKLHEELPCFTEGEVRKMVWVKVGNAASLLVVRNHLPVQLLRFKHQIHK